MAETTAATGDAVAADLEVLHTKLADLSGRLNNTLSYWSLATLWYASLGLKSALVAACDRLKAVGTLAEDRATDLLAKIDAMLPHISHVFDRMRDQRDQAAALGVAAYVRPFLAELAGLTDNWISAFVESSPASARDEAALKHSIIKQGFDRASEAYARD